MALHDEQSGLVFDATVDAWQADERGWGQVTWFRHKPFFHKERLMKNVLITVALSALAASAFAVDAGLVEKSIPLKDGTTVYLFKDGKMGMEDKLGRTVRMKQGHVMETKDGQKIIMIGDEVARLDWIKADKRGGN